MGVTIMNPFNSLVQFKLHTTKGGLFSGLIKTTDAGTINYYIDKTENGYVLRRHDVLNGISVKIFDEVGTPEEAVVLADDDFVELLRKRYYDTETGLYLDVLFAAKKALEYISANKQFEPLKPEPQDKLIASMPWFYYEDIIRSIHDIIIIAISQNKSLFDKIFGPRQDAIMKKLIGDLSEKIIVISVLEQTFLIKDVLMMVLSKLQEV